MKNPYTAKSWIGIMRRLSQDFDTPPWVGMAWSATESAFNPASVGWPQGARTIPTDKQGRILESGLFQLMSPHEITAAGTSVAQMRAGCSRDVSTPAQAQSLRRLLTKAEALEHVRAGLALTEQFRARASDLIRNQALPWTDAEAWYLTKLFHATSNPAIMTQAVTAHMGSPPTWQQFTLHAAASAPKGDGAVWERRVVNVLHFIRHSHTYGGPQ